MHGSTSTGMDRGSLIIFVSEFNCTDVFQLPTSWNLLGISLPTDRYGTFALRVERISVLTRTTQACLTASISPSTQMAHQLPTIRSHQLQWTCAPHYRPEGRFSLMPRSAPPLDGLVGTILALAGQAESTNAAVAGRLGSNRTSMASG